MRQVKTCSNYLNQMLILVQLYVIFLAYADNQKVIATIANEIGIRADIGANVLVAFNSVVGNDIKDKLKF